MKQRLIAAILVLVLLEGCTAIPQNFIYEPKGEININYNNIYDSEFAIAKDAAYYSHLPIYTKYLLRLSEKGETKITSRAYNTMYDIQLQNDKVYYLSGAKNPPVSLTDTDTSYRLEDLCSYDPATNQIQHIMYLGDVWRYMVYRDYVFWQSDYDSPLYFSPLQNQKTVKICDSVTTFGVMGDKIVYVTPTDDGFSLYHYSIEQRIAICLGKFQDPPSDYVKEFEELPPDYAMRIHFNFTSDKTIHCDIFESSILFYDWKTNTVQTIQVEGEISHFTAYENYAFYVVNDGTWNTLYRMDLKTGNSEKVAQKEKIKFIVVTSDNDVYAAVPKPEDISPEDELTTRPTQAIHFSMITGSAKVIFEYYY